MSVPNIDIPIGDRKISQLIRTLTSETRQALIEIQPPNAGGGGNMSVLESKVDMLMNQTNLISQSFAPGGMVGNMKENIRLLNTLSPSAISRESEDWVADGEASLISEDGSLSIHFSGDGSAWVNRFPGETLAGDISRGVAIKNLKAGDQYLFSADFNLQAFGSLMRYPNIIGSIVESSDNINQTNELTLSSGPGLFTYFYTVPENMSGGSLAFGVLLNDQVSLDPAIFGLSLDNMNVRNVTQLTSLADRVTALERAIEAP